MIAPSKHRQALWSLNWILVAARTMAYEKADHESIAEVLDAAEYLPCLMLEKVDRTEHFREYIAELAKRFPSMNLAVERSDSDRDPYLDRHP